MARAHEKEQMSLAIQRIEPVNLDNPSVMASLEQTRRSMANPNLAKILEVRTAISHCLSDALFKDGFVHPPVYMLAGCTDPLNHWTYPARLNYYGEEVSVSQSLILYKMLMVMLTSAPKVYWVSPNIRMEMRIGRKDYKYVTEFTQVDFEKRGATFEEMLDYVSALTCKVYDYLNTHHAEALMDLRGALLPKLQGRLEVFDCQDTRKAQGLADDDAVEKWTAKQTDGRPFLVTNLKREAYDCFDDHQNKFLNYDVVIPPFGDNPYPIECVSGAERTRTLDDLEQRMKDLGYPMAYFAPFFELFDSLDTGNGRISSAGAGFGVERLTYAILGLKDIHDIYPFPRMAEGKIAV